MSINYNHLFGLERPFAKIDTEIDKARKLLNSSMLADLSKIKSFVLSEPDDKGMVMAVGIDKDCKIICFLDPDAAIELASMDNIEINFYINNENTRA